MSTPASADIWGDCTKAIEDGDLGKAKELATKMLSFNSISKEHREEGAACLTNSFGQEYIYSVALNTFATKVQDAEHFAAARKDFIEKAAEEKKL